MSDERSRQESPEQVPGPQCGAQSSKASRQHGSGPLRSPGPHRRHLRGTYTLITLGIALLVAWVLIGDYLPWWSSALVLAAAPIATIEAVRLARRAGAA